MEVYDVIRTALAVREYQDQPVPPELTRRILEAAWLTASSMNKQPWHFIAIDDREILRELAGMARSGPYLAQAPLAVAVLVEKDSRFGVSDASRAIQSMVLAAWAEGLGSNWVGFFGLDAMKPVLGVPDNLDILAIVPFGYPLKKIGRGKKKRKPFSSVVHKGKFGQAYQ